MLKGLPIAGSAQRWADLGCGSGTFTLALADLLPQDSVIHAMDRDASALRRVPRAFKQVTIAHQLADFTDEPLELETMDGILMANSLHYLRDQARFLSALAGLLRPAGVIALVEYDTDTANPWVPYPVSYARLTSLLEEAGFADITRLAERVSVFGQARMYAAYARR